LWLETVIVSIQALRSEGWRGAAMADFRDREEVKRWLDGIKPAQRRREVATALAARAALRVLPLLGRELRRGMRERDEILSSLVLPCLRAKALPWVAGKYPTNDNELRADASAAAFAAADARAVDAAATDVAYADARAAGAISNTDARDAVDIAADATAYTVSATDKAAATVAHTAVNATADALAADGAQIDSGRSGGELSRLPLWSIGAPDWAIENWRTLKSALLAANQDWEVWTDWYEARLAGDAAYPPNEALEVARATIPDEIWKQGPAVVNAEIKRLIAEHPTTLVVSTAALGIETRASVADVAPTIASLQGAEARAAVGEFVPNPAPPPSGWMNAGDDRAVQLAARARLQTRAALDTAFTTHPPFPLFIDATTPLTHLPPVETIPSQEPAATQFRADAEGRIDVVQIPPSTDVRQRLLYDEMRHKAQELAALGQMLGDVSPAVDRILEALPERMEDASVDKLWSRGNTLRRRLDAHVRAIENILEPNPARLDDLAAAALGDFVDSFNVYVVGDPRAVELDSARLGPQDREAARKIAALAVPIARAASELQSPATPAAQEALTEQVDAAVDAPDDINGDQAADLARRTMGNFVSELLRRAYAPIAKLGGDVTKEVIFALKEFRSGLYRASGTATFMGLSAAAYAYWPEISAFVVRNADALRDLVMELFHNPRLVEIIDLIVQVAKHLG
jgi:hypothetical protein